MSFDEDPFGTNSFENDAVFEDFNAFDKQSAKGGELEEDDFFGSPQPMDWADSQFSSAPIVTGVKKMSVAEDDWFDAGDSTNSSLTRRQNNGKTSSSSRHGKKFPDNSPRGDTLSGSKKSNSHRSRRASLSSHGIGKKSGSRQNAEEKSVQSAMELGSRSRRRKTLHADQEEDVESITENIGGSHHLRRPSSRRHLVKGRSKRNNAERPGMNSKGSSRRIRNASPRGENVGDQPLENYAYEEEEKLAAQRAVTNNGPTGKRRIRSTNSAGAPSARNLAKANAGGENEDRERRRVHRRGSRKPVARSRSNDLSGIFDSEYPEGQDGGDARSVQSSRSSVRSKSNGGRRRRSEKNMRDNAELAMAALQAEEQQEQEQQQEQQQPEEEFEDDNDNPTTPEDFKAALEEEGSESEDERRRRQSSSLGLGNGLRNDPLTSRRRVTSSYLPMNLASNGAGDDDDEEDDDRSSASTSSDKMIDRIRSRSAQRDSMGRRVRQDRSVSIDRNTQKANARAEERRKKRLSIQQQIEAEEKNNDTNLASSISGFDTYNGSKAMRGIRRELSDNELAGIRKVGRGAAAAPTTTMDKRRASSSRHLDGDSQRRSRQREHEQTSLFYD